MFVSPIVAVLGVGDIGGNRDTIMLDDRFVNVDVFGDTQKFVINFVVRLVNIAPVVGTGASSPASIVQIRNTSSQVLGSTRIDDGQREIDSSTELDSGLVKGIIKHGLDLVGSYFSRPTEKLKIKEARSIASMVTLQSGLIVILIGIMHALSDVSKEIVINSIKSLLSLETIGSISGAVLLLFLAIRPYHSWVTRQKDNMSDLDAVKILREDIEEKNARRLRGKNGSSPISLRVKDR